MRNEPRQPLRRRPGMIFDNQIVDDARGRAKTPLVLPRPRFCSRSRSGDGACLKRRRCWSDSRREHRGGARLRQPRPFRGPTEDGYRLKLDAPTFGSRSGIRLVSKTGQRGSIPRQPARARTDRVERRRALPAGAHRGRFGTLSGFRSRCREGWALPGLISLEPGRFDSDPCNSSRDLAPPPPSLRCVGERVG